MQDKSIPERDQLIGQVNYWQSLKSQQRFDEVRQEVEAADFSAKYEPFRLAQLALLDDETAFFDLLPKALQAKKLTNEDLREWPLFREMRETATYKENYTSRERDQEEVNGRGNAT